MRCSRKSSAHTSSQQATSARGLEFDSVCEARTQGQETDARFSGKGNKLVPHLVLLGDSILDNGRYTSGGPDVVAQVRRLLPNEWKASLLAVDGSTTKDIERQMQHLPKDATHLVLSVGGNDAIMNSSLLGFSLFGFGSAASASAGALQEMAQVSEEFANSYRSAIDVCLNRRLPLVVCTIYNCCFPDASYQRLITTGLAIFNDVIVSAAIERRLPIIDLRLICSEPADYANANRAVLGGRRKDREDNRRLSRWSRRNGSADHDLRLDG